MALSERWGNHPTKQPTSRGILMIFYDLFLTPKPNESQPAALPGRCPTQKVKFGMKIFEIAKWGNPRCTSHPVPTVLGEVGLI